jgi:hypothetical protein
MPACYPISSTYVDLMMSICILLWSEVTFRGADLGTTSKRALERIDGHLTALDRTLVEWQ